MKRSRGEDGTAGPSWPRRHRGALAALGVVGVVVLPVALAGIPLADDPGESDAVLVLGPPLRERTAVGERIVAEGHARELVVSTYAPDAPDRPKHVPICDDPQPIRVTCFVADPATTQGEAQYVGRLARERGWRSLQVVTFGPHVNRARVLVQRCYDGDVRVLEADDHVAPIDVAHHVAGWVKLATYWTC